MLKPNERMFTVFPDAGFPASTLPARSGRAAVCSEGSAGGCAVCGALKTLYADTEPPLVLKLGRDTCKLFERDRFATKKELAELKKLAADASALFPTDFHDAKPKRVKKKFVEQKRAETAGTTQ